ncbi:hypothetical protein D9619_004584 [Psilocybe cf. subviscida]|uniref:Cytochrome P450 n=1 Tax=Psilocybe cf. subviscida TaxID=2480587 RepID=A0A8H5BQA2_9AGAR|nr:hypothetical protein D9619_004584 [Psilocybe cf. subviscida]
MTPATLPQEVLAAIVESGPFSKHELSMISLVSPHLRHEAQRKLFQDPGMHCINVASSSSQLAMARAFLHAILSSPSRLALMVRRYHVVFLWRDFASPQHSETVDARVIEQNTIINHLSQGLELMANLVELQLYTDTRHIPRDTLSRPPSMASILKHCTFQLDVFHCSYYDTGLYDRKLLRDFLYNQQHIHELRIQKIHSSAANMTMEDPNAFQNMCPSVVSVGGESTLIAGMLLAGQRLEHISWQGSWFEHGDTLLQAPNATSVELMECIGGHGPQLSLICSTFPNLVLLKIGSLDMIKILKNPGMLGNLPRLNVLLVALGVLDLWSSNRSFLVVASPENSIRHFLSGSLSLQYVEAHDSEGGTKYIIDRATQLITVYTVPIDSRMHNGERKQELLQRVTTSVGENDVFVKMFPILRGTVRDYSQRGVNNVAFTAGIIQYSLSKYGIATAGIIPERNPSRAPLPPGPKGYPLIGSVFDMPTSKQWLTYAQWAKVYGNVFSFEALGQRIIVLNSLEAAQELLEKRSANYSDRPRLPMCLELGFAELKLSRAILHDEEVFTEPEEFRPERYLKDGQLDLSVHQPEVSVFGFGRRICPGRYSSDNIHFSVVASTLHSFIIIPALDEKGVPIPLSKERTSGLISYPVPFKVDIKPRSPSAEILIKDAMLGDN